MLDLTKLSYIQAAPNTYRVASGRLIQQIIIHTSEAPKVPGSARAIAEYFHDGSEGRSASAHYCVDAQQIYHCVQNQDIAFGAPGANTNGLHVEHAGFAAQSAAEWADAYNTQMLDLSGLLVATLCRQFDIPARWLSPEEVAVHEQGLSSHLNVTLGYPRQHGTHTDPGVNFPVSTYLQRVAAHLLESATQTLPAQHKLVTPTVQAEK